MGNLPSLKDLLGLCKIKVVMLILLTAVVGMLLAVPYVPSLLLIIAASAGISLAAMSAAVFNHVVDEKIDMQMSRTDRRPLPQGKVTRTQALIWGIFFGRCWNLPSSRFCKPIDCSSNPSFFNRIRPSFIRCI
jgi:protoheme IX farnesyltransferase